MQKERTGLLVELNKEHFLSNEQISNNFFKLKYEIVNLKGDTSLGNK